MKITILLFAIFASLVALSCARDIPVNAKDPSLEYEIINPQSQPQPAVPKKPSIEDAANQSNQNKTLAYDPITQKWTVLKPSDEVKDGTLLWNQSNDKWLTQSFIP